MKTLIDLLPLMFSEPGAPVASGWIQIMKTGSFTYQGKKINITQNDLNEFAENFHKKVRGVDLAVDISHKSEDGSVGWFEDVKAENGKLLAKVRWTDEGEQLVKSGKFRYFSPEWSRQWTDSETQKTYKNVLFGGALTNRPFLKGMDPVGIAMSEDGMTTIQTWADDSDTDDDSSSYDPDGDGDDDSTSDPEKNPDWIDDVQKGHLPFDKTTGRQQQQLKSRGITKERADGARAQFLSKHPEHKDRQFEDRSTNASQKPKETRVSMNESDFDKFLVALYQFAEDSVANAHKSPPAGKPKDPSQYADPAHFKYPIDSKHIQAAINYYNHDGMREKGGYSEEQWTSIGQKIVAAANKELGDGYSCKDGKIVTPAKKMDDGSGPNDGTKNLNPDDGDETPGKINDGESGKFSELNHKSKTKGSGNMPPVSDEQYQAVVDRVNTLEAELRRNKMSEKVDGFIKAGKMVPAARDNTVEMLIGMSEDQVNKFSEMMDKTPQIVKFSEEGFSGDPGEADGDKLMAELQAQYVADGKTPRVAMSEAFAEVKKRGLKISGFDD